MDALLHDREFMLKLQDVSPESAAKYAAAVPYAHAVFDDFFPPRVLEEVLADFPQPGQLDWQKFNNANEKKLAFRQAEQMPTRVRDFLYFLNSHPMLQFLEKLTGIGGLIPDPSFNGGGCHQIERGGKLQVHVDFNKLMPANLDRRLNLLVYLNADWKDEYGGHFELWDEKATGCVTKVAPLFNRCVVFSTTETSYHGHPHPLTCPEGRTRKSIATYLYTNGRPDHEEAASHTTVFLGKEAAPRWGAADWVKYLTPPAVVDAVKSLKRQVTGAKP
jgi:Rps23 Pro-64 3,4-dihydroxylase Tpa1-like proline 4-hydroxylase